MKDRIEHLSKEFSGNSQETEKLKKVFQDFSVVQDSIEPDKKFRNNLKQRLATLQEIKGVSTHIQQRQYHLFGGVFASFLFIGGFLFFMSDSLFQNPISGEETTIETRMVEEDNTSADFAPFYEEETTFDIPENTSQKSSIPDELPPQDTSESSGIPQEGVSQDSEINIPISESPKQDTSSSEITSSPEGEKTSTTTIPTQDSSVAPSSERSAQDSASDETFAPAASMMMMDAPAQDNESGFQNYCLEVSGIYNNSTVEPSCANSGQVCLESEYNQTGICFIQDSPLENDMEIILQELMNDVSE